MKFTCLHTADQWITKILSYPGIDKKTLSQKKIYWIASLAVSVMTFCLTLTYHLIFPQLRILIYYGFFLTVIFMQGVIFPFFIRSMNIWWQFIDQTLVAIATLYCILKLGGIPYSGGLIFVGLALVFFSLNFSEKRATISLFIIYLITVIIAGVLHPYLTVPPEMTSSVNISLFVINLLWISGFAMAFVMNFISQGIKMEQLEANRLKELDKAKTELYTNITHEFRTPLTIITGTMDLIRNEPEKWLEEGSETIDKNAKIILKLVNQMLDLSKLEAGAMPVNNIRADINLYIRYIVELFRSYATDKKIVLSFNSQNLILVMDYDPDKLMQIISNLLTNALKFTQSCGKVELSTALKDNTAFEIRISDDGPGIPEDKIPYIFDRFYRLEDPKAYSLPGSGIGLTVTRKLVKLLNGRIYVESTIGEGSEFIIRLPVTYNAALQVVQNQNELKEKSSIYIPSTYKKDISPSTQEISNDNKPILLIVEDNKDVIRYLHTILEDAYKIITAANGKDGMKKALKFIPDIILSDIMMPIMNGIEMLDMLKNDFHTSHIPVVMLTAKADIASRLEGLEKQADAYISKPFHKDELLLQLKSLIEVRNKLQKRYAALGNLILPEEKYFQKEDDFMQEIRRILFANLSDEKFDINWLCHDMVMSRTQLYRKFKSLTNTTIKEYLRSIRLHKAKELLKTTDINATQVAYATGFKNISHFSRVFTQEFGINPSKIH